MPHFRSPVGEGSWLNAWLPGRADAMGRAAVAELDEPVSRADYYAAVSAVLWSERELLESLVCTVVVDQLMTHGRSARRAASQLQRDSLGRLGLQEVLRSAMVESLQAVIDGPPNVTLRELAAYAPEPWQTVLTEHREALKTLAGDLRSVAGFEQLSLREFLA